MTWITRSAAVVAAVTLAVAGVRAQGAPAGQADTASRTKATRTGATESAATPETQALPGTIVRWTVPGTKRCGMSGRTWAAVQETCYYPVDVLRKPGTIRVSRHGAGKPAYARITVSQATFPDLQVTLGDIPQANPSAADLRRDAREQAIVDRIWARPERAAQFTLPLGRPAATLPQPSGFATRYIFNGNQQTTEIHNGVDYALPEGTQVVSAADGVVVLARELFFAGNAVFVDHGNGLVTEYFHLRDINVQPGQQVRKGQTLGVAGSTGRVTGPHLHFGARWHGGRIDPTLLLNDPARIPEVSE